MIERKLLFLVNPISGTRKKEKLIGFITDKLNAVNISLKLKFIFIHFKLQNYKTKRIKI